MLVTDLHQHINRARDQHDRDVAVEQLEAAVARIDEAVGFPHAGRVPAPQKGTTGDELLSHARTCLRNGDLTGARLNLLQVLELGPPVQDVPAGKPLSAMTKAELVAYAADRGIEISSATGKAALLEQLQEAEAETPTD